MPNYDMFLKCDIKDFFPSVDVNILLSKLDNIVYDKKLVKKVAAFLEDEHTKLKIKGISIGSPLSPVLSNIYLKDFDIYFSTKSDIKYIRFCDDMMFFANKNIISEIGNELGKIGLTLSKKKTVIGFSGDTVKFLGFYINCKGAKKGSDKRMLKDSENLKGKRALPYGYNEIVSEIDLVDIIDIINYKEEEKFLKLLPSFEFYEFNKTTIEKLALVIKEKMGEAYEMAFKYAVMNLSKDEIVNEFVEKEHFSQAYKFEEIISRIKFESRDVDIFKKLFQGRDGEYYLSNIGCKKEYTRKSGEISNDDIRRHLKGEISLAIRLDRHDATSKMIVFDIDSSNEAEAITCARNIKKCLNKKGYSAYIEFSGMKGYHVWMFFNRFIRIDTLENLAQEVISNISFLETSIEYMPRPNFITETQNIIKLPLGIHPETKKLCIFIDIDDLKEITLNEDIIEESHSFDGDFTEKIKENYPEAYKILSGCSVMRHLVELGVKKGKMSHFERLIVLYVFSYINKGREFIHHLMEQFDGYSYNITEKNLNKAPERPISCRKIREYFKDSEIISDCTCKFDKKEGVYSTPVIYSDSSTFSKVSIESSIKETVQDIIKLNEQRDELDKKIRNIEKRLNSMFNVLGCDEVDVEIGSLKRIKEGDVVKWVIEMKM